MLNQSYEYYDHPEFDAASIDKYSTFSDVDKTEYSKLEADFASYQKLKTRVIELLASGYTLRSLAIDTEPKQINYRDVGKDQWEGNLKRWLDNYKNCRAPSHFSNQPTLAEVIENSLNKFFDDLDSESVSKNLAEVFLMTSVSKKMITGFNGARRAKELVEITTPAGSGKTFTTNQYIAICRKEEGFNCPIWRITMKESNNNLKHVLLEIVQAMRAQSSQNFSFNGGFNITDNEYTLSREIERIAGSQKGGLLIIDEAQNMFNKLRGATTHHGLGIINELRTFTDAKLMGIVLISNGEVYKKVMQADAVQIARRMEAWRVDAGKPTNEDVELVMQSWGVSGKDERIWSIKVGTGKGGLGALTSFYRRAQMEYGEINNDILTSYKYNQ